MSSSARKSLENRKKNIAAIVGVTVAAGLLGFASYTATKPEEPSAATAEKGASDPAASPGASAVPRKGAYPELEALARRDADDPLAQGRADAPVVMIEYADFKCGFCGKFARDTEPDLVKKYVADGTLRIEWRNFPIFGEDSERAARGAWAAGRQGRFWQFHEAAYADGAKDKGFGGGRLKELARAAGVKDVERFAEDADSGAARDAVKKDQDEGFKLGAASTPSFLVNGQPIAGAQSDAVFERAIEAAAAASSSSGSSGSSGSSSSSSKEGRQ
ncbi:DsbA family protein [Streptomyces sp. NPDC017940]|uniref:DsbA family protein n=1 Tax=Streptomyces sp. NPDC017940 TaxID=3365017 RepID=UPI0037AEB502